MVVRFYQKTVGALVVAMTLLMTFGGCATNERTEPLAVPRALASMETPGRVGVGGGDPEHVLSPDGKYILATMSDDGGSRLVLLELGADGFELIEVDSVIRDWSEQAYFSYGPIGWISETRFVYSKVGHLSTESIRDQGGVALAIGIGDLATRLFEETDAFIPLRSSYILTFSHTLYVPDRAKVFIDFRTTVWEFDIVQKSFRLVRDCLPDSLYHSPRPSPTGEYYVYYRQDENEGKEGLYILDTATGEERIFMPNGDTMSFYPSWSFDGKYIAVYTVGRKPGIPGTTWHSYDAFEGNDTAQDVGQAITVLDPQGRIVSSIHVEGKYVRSFLWAGNTQNIAFMAGTREPPDGGPPSISTESLWMAKIGGTGQSVPRKLAAIPATPSGGFLSADLAAFDAAGEGVYYYVYDRGVWYARENGEPVQVLEGVWWGPETAYAAPQVVWDGVIALVDEWGHKHGLYLISGGKGIRFAEHGDWSWVLAYDKSRLVIFAGSALQRYPGPGRVIAYSVARE